MPPGAAAYTTAFAAAAASATTAWAATTLSGAMLNVDGRAASLDANSVG